MAALTSIDSLESRTDEREAPTAEDTVPSKHLHFFMLIICGVLLAVSVVGFRLTSTSGMPSLPAAIVVLIVSAFPAVLWHDRGQYSHRDAALTLPWIASLIFLIPSVAVLSARLGFRLRDADFVVIDHALGFSVPAIMAWSVRHSPIGALLRYSYPLLSWLLGAAVIAPILSGKRDAAERFLLANTIALLLAIPTFTLFPAVGPWAGYRFAADAAQRACQESIILLHNSSRVNDQTTIVAIICFPSFHVIWAVLGAAALWSVKALRIPAAVLAALIIASTVTTGWHYVADVLAGLVLAGISVGCAYVAIERLHRRKHDIEAQVIEMICCEAAGESGFKHCRHN